MTPTHGAAPVAPSALFPADARAYWLQPGLLAWPAGTAPELSGDGRRWRLHSAPDGGLRLVDGTVHGGRSLPLHRDSAGLPDAVLAAYPHLRGYLALRPRQSRPGRARRLLTGQVAVAAYGSQGALRDVTGVQIAPVLDALYGRATSRQYGVRWARRGARIQLWAPTAIDVVLLTWPASAARDAPPSQARRRPLRRSSDGSWAARTSALRPGSRYLFEIRVYQPRTQRIETNLVTDPYSASLTLGSTRSVAVDLTDRALMPRVWRRSDSPTLARFVDSTIYELHVRDFSVHDPSVPAARRGSYLAFAERKSSGSRHLQRLAEAGMNTVHLLPTFDLASVEEDPALQQQPACDLRDYPPNSDRQQACIAEVANDDAYNWGYDPWHWMAPEGSYASSPSAADGPQRIAELRTMIGELHRAGLRVVLDQVYNHTPASGQAPTSVLDRIVPGYYHRLGALGQVEHSTCCENVATEHAMAEKIMVDAVVHWARHYRVDGFRFDLMGHHSTDTMRAVRAALDELTLRRDGVDGASVYLYGEGWNFGEVANNARFHQAVQGQLSGTGIGTFSDRLRDAVRGGSTFDRDPRRQGWGTGLLTDPNDLDQPDGRHRLTAYTDLVQLGLAGNLGSFGFRSADGRHVRGAEISYFGSPAGYADEPGEVVTYVDAHDNETLFDALTYKLPRSTAMSDRIRMNTLALATTALAQTPSFWHAGADLLRSKSLDRNSYNSGDWFNTLDWTGADNGFGHGLPPAADNRVHWDYQRPLLADPALKPTAADVASAAAAAADLLRLRFSTPLFRLGSAELIRQKVSFPVSGGPHACDAVVVMHIDDTLGVDVDRSIRNVVIVLNASPAVVQQRIPALAGVRLRLSPVQQSGSDPVVRRSRWNAGNATAQVPARTVAVFVRR